VPAVMIVYRGTSIISFVGFNGFAIFPQRNRIICHKTVMFNNKRRLAIF